MSPHHATLLAFAAREVMNYHCADLIKSFGNLVLLKWPTNSPASTKMNIEHYTINLLGRIHTANIEQYYDHAFDLYKYITDRSRTKEAHNPHNLMQNNAGHPPDQSVPDRQWGNNFINDTLIPVTNIEDAIHEIVKTLNSINHTVELISPVYPDGMPTIPPSLNVQKILKEVLTKLDLGPPEDPTRQDGDLLSIKLIGKKGPRKHASIIRSQINQPTSLPPQNVQHHVPGPLHHHLYHLSRCF